MSIAEFRRMALEIPTAVELSHMNHPDFRIAGRIFATLGAPNESWGMVKLTPDEQRMFIKKAPLVFKPCNGAWGRRGCTNVHLASAKSDILREALRSAATNVAALSKRKKPNQSPEPMPGPVTPRALSRNSK